MVAQPASVPAVRSFVHAALTGWGYEALLEDVGLCVSELATNATLHADSPYFHVELERRSESVRLAVADTGAVEVDLLARQPELSDAFLAELTVDDAAATGRGMFLVSALATMWGIDELPVGKRIWAEFHAEGDGSAAGGAGPTTARVAHILDAPAPDLDPAEWAVVRFRGCPPDLLVAHDENLADYTRELYLIGDRLEEPSYQELAAVMDGYVAEHAANWEPARIIAREALRKGRELVDFDVVATRHIRESIRFLRHLIWAAEALSRQGRLMTLPAEEPVQRLRDWLEGEFLAQIEASAEPIPYPDWLAGARQ